MSHANSPQHALSSFHARTEPGSETGSETESGSAFWRWVRGGLAAKHWDMQTLALHAGIAPSTLTALRKDPQRRPSAETCRKIARALGIAEPIALEIAGYLMPGEVRSAVHAATGQQMHTVRDPDTGQVDLLPTPARMLPADDLELAKIAVQLVGDDRLSSEDKWRITTLIDALAYAQELTRVPSSDGQARQQPPLPVDPPAPDPAPDPDGMSDARFRGASTTRCAK